MAIRDEQFKLIHAFVNNPQSQWYSFENPLNDDGDMSSFSCPQFSGY